MNKLSKYAKVARGALLLLRGWRRTEVGRPHESFQPSCRRFNSRSDTTDIKRQTKRETQRSNNYDVYRSSRNGDNNKQNSSSEKEIEGVKLVPEAYGRAKNGAKHRIQLSVFTSVVLLLLLPPSLLPNSYPGFIPG